jgi:hypothetical protein
VLDLITAFLAAIRAFFRSGMDTSLEILALRQQVAVLKRKRPRPSLNRLDRFFWTMLRHIWPRWSDCSGHCETGDGGRTASGGLSPVLALAIATARRPTQDEREDSGSYSPHGD